MKKSSWTNMSLKPRTASADELNCPVEGPGYESVGAVIGTAVVQGSKEVEDDRHSTLTIERKMLLVKEGLSRCPCS